MIPPCHSAAFGADPERARAVEEQTQYAAVGQSLRLAEHFEPDAVETGEAIERAEPEISVGRLRDGRDGVGWKAIGRLP